jgi:hypothetical protein
MESSSNLTMATENDKGKGKESEQESARHSTRWPGRFHEGKWFCDCEGSRKARCLTVRQLSSENHGRQCISFDSYPLFVS